MDFLFYVKWSQGSNTFESCIENYFPHFTNPNTNKFVTQQWTTSK